MRKIEPPVAKKIPYRLEKHGDVRIDNYFWLKDRDSKDVIDYLKAENKYTELVMKDYKKVEKQIYKELKSRIKEDYQTAPVKYKNYLYFKRYKKGKDYPIYYRKKIGLEKPELLLDVNDIAKDREFCHVSKVQVSPSQEILAYAVDYVGRRFYTIYFKDLKTGKMLDTKIENVTSNFAWSNDSNIIYYVKQDSETLRWQGVWKFNIKSKTTQKLYYEDDKTYSVYLTKSNSENYLFMTIDSTLTTEVRYLEPGSENEVFKIFRPRQKGLEYYVEDGGDRFFIRSNDNAKNFKISYVMKDENHTDKNLWKNLIEHNDSVLLEDMEVFKDWIVIMERENGLVNFRIIDRNNGGFSYIKFPDEVYSASFGENLEYETNYFRYEYESMVNPPSTYDYDFLNKNSILVKRKEVPNYNPSEYETKRVWISARDGVRVPLSILYKKNSSNDKLYLYGYGSYGYSIDPYFNSTLFPLVDRGFVYVIAHIRGGSELGRAWYENGRQLNKKNTFYDFIDATKALIELGYGKNGVFAEGGSAGGLLMGAIANIAPELYKGIISEVPFVDVLTTMLDESIPLTTSEYDEWGNPNIKEYYDYIKSYSPYDNIEKKCYPNILVTSGYNDSQVQYWEPAKWVAKLRDNNECDSFILLKMDMSSGHSGKTGRYKYLEDIAFNYAFVLNVAGIK
ncbi:MAG: S9 family peptidase [Elusimicrobiota bacterium]